MAGWKSGRWGIFIISLILAANLLCPGLMKHGVAIADQKAGAPAPREERGVSASGEAAGYHTALAGEPLHTVFMGKTVDIPALDRRRVTALRTSHTPKFRIVRSFFM